MSDIDDGRAAHLDGLRRIAFGRANTPEEHAAAAAAHEALARAEAEDSAAAAEAAAAEHAEVGAAEPTDPGRPSVDDEPQPPDAPARVWIVPAVVALVAGALLGGTATNLVRATPVAAPTAATSFTPGSSPRPASAIPVTAGAAFTSGPGNLEGAEGWFSRTQTDNDLNELFFGDPTRYVPESIRLVQSTGSGEIWVAKTPDGGLCLMATSKDGGGGTCATADEFTQRGLAVGHATVQVAWDGVRMAVSYSAP